MPHHGRHGEWSGGRPVPGYGREYDLGGRRSGFGEGSYFGGYGGRQRTTDAYDIAYRNFRTPRGR